MADDVGGGHFVAATFIADGQPRKLGEYVQAGVMGAVAAVVPPPPVPPVPPTPPVGPSAGGWGTCTFQQLVGLTEIAII